MTIVRLNEDNEKQLYNYLLSLQEKVPYYFKTSKELLKDYLMNDQLNHHQLMATNYIYLAIEDERCVGMIQFGIQAVDFNERGEFLVKPLTGNIRHLFYHNEKEVGRALMKMAMDFFAAEHIDEIYAFNHVAGLSCYSKHGKLHESMPHIHQLLMDHGFKSRHENVYYVLDIGKSKPLKDTLSSMDDKLDLIIEHQYDRDYIKLIDTRKDPQVIGVSEVTKLSLWSKDALDPKLYLRYIHINSIYRGKGYSKFFIAKLCEHYHQEGIGIIHTDTSLYNQVAQNLYESLAFTHEGITRDYKFTRC